MLWAKIHAQFLQFDHHAAAAKVLGKREVVISSAAKKDFKSGVANCQVCQQVPPRSPPNC
eukprot:2957335-Amphidinium_carterae.1